MGNGPEHDARPPGTDRRDRSGSRIAVLALADATQAMIDGGGWPDVSAAYARYNLACFHALGGRLDEARALLRQALPADEELRERSPRPTTTSSRSRPELEALSVR